MIKRDYTGNASVQFYGRHTPLNSFRHFLMPVEENPVSMSELGCTPLLSMYQRLRRSVIGFPVQAFEVTCGVFVHNLFCSWQLNISISVLEEVLENIYISFHFKNRGTQKNAHSHTTSTRNGPRPHCPELSIGQTDQTYPRT